MKKMDCKSVATWHASQTRTSRGSFVVISFIVYFAMPMMLSAQSDTNNYAIRPQILTHYTQEFYPFGNGRGVGFHSGINIIAPISKRFFIRTGINYSERKIKYEIGNTFIVSLYPWYPKSLYGDSYQLSYFQLPVQLQYIFFQKKKINIYMLGGIKANIIRREIITGKTTDGIEDSFTTTNAAQYINVFAQPDYVYKQSYVTIGCGENYFLRKNFLVGFEAGINFNIYGIKQDLIINTGINFSYLFNTKK